MNPGYVYFIKSLGPNGYIKIGHTNNVKKRFTDIQNMSGEKLEMLGFYFSDDCKIEEQQLHLRFRIHRKHGEWFDDVTELREYIGQTISRLSFKDIETMLSMINKELFVLRTLDQASERSVKKAVADEMRYRIDNMLHYASEAMNDCYRIMRDIPNLSWRIASDLESLRLNIRRILDAFFVNFQETNFAISNAKDIEKKIKEIIETSNALELMMPKQSS